MKKKVFTALSKATTDLKRILEADAELSEADRLFIQNHMFMLQMAYSEWKHRKKISD